MWNYSGYLQILKLLVRRRRQKDMLRTKKHQLENQHMPESPDMVAINDE